MKMQIEYPQKIADSTLFNGLNLTEMGLFLEQSKTKNFQVGDYIMKEHEESDEFYWIAAGRVEIQVVAKARAEMIGVNSLTVGDILGEMTLLGFSDRMASA